MGAEVLVEQQHGYRARKNRHRGQQQESGNKPGPDEQGHLQQRHLRRPHVHDGHDNVDCAHDRGRTEYVNGKYQERKRVTGLQDQRRVHGPASRGRTTGHKQRRDQEGKADREQPETPVVHSRQRHVGGADHHRYHPVGQAHERRHYRAKNHDQPMHGGHLVKERGIDKLQARLEQFGPDDHDHGSADKKHQQGKHQVHGPDVFVVGRKKPALDPARCTVVIVIVCLILIGRGLVLRAHTVLHLFYLAAAISEACTVSPLFSPQALRS